ncbi:DUF2493 domain-containing protein [Streptosporangiaceae bacterium NEAU-GS5]|nr:DUF2493 domain-containing protein [Streptosporangiaceae bacterium NEAU-GS5]
MTQTRRVLVTGSRTWTDTATIHAAVVAEWGDGMTTLVSDGCPRGADAIAESIWQSRGGHVERHPADWTRDGQRAGLIRNADMVTRGADLCLAFIHNDSPAPATVPLWPNAPGSPSTAIPTLDHPPPQSLPNLPAAEHRGPPPSGAALTWKSRACAATTKTPCTPRAPKRADGPYTSRPGPKRPAAAQCRAATAPHEPDLQRTRF